MEFGASIFFTDYSITPAALAVALEERGFDSVWAAEHSHIPVPRLTPPPSGGELAKRYYDVMDPFVTLTAAACATKTLKVATGICLVIQRDTIQTAKLVASIDQVSGGRFLFGIGGGWNVEEVEAHGTDFGTRMQKMREQMEAMKEIWTKSTAQYTGEIVKVPSMQTWPKPVQKPYPPILVGGAFPWAARRAIRYGDGWYPNASSGKPEEYLPRYWKMAEEAGRDRKSVPVTIGGAPEDLDQLKRFRDLGVSRAVVTLLAEGADQILPVLDRWAGLIRQVNA
jgi:probable F420-dependent oxidoreductase